MVLIIDNYDSFTYNVYQALSTMAEKVTVVRNDEISAKDLEKMNLSHLVISPGPGRPEGAGISKESIELMAGRLPILGVCLGHQAIGEVYGSEVVHAAKLMHGKSSSIEHGGNGLYRGLPNPFEAIRYHSLGLKRSTIPSDLEITSEADDGEVMGIRHRTLLVEGVQFHPESFGTIDGNRIFENFLMQEGGTRNDA